MAPSFANGENLFVLNIKYVFCLTLYIFNYFWIISNFYLDLIVIVSKLRKYILRLNINKINIQ